MHLLFSNDMRKENTIKRLCFMLVFWTMAIVAHSQQYVVWQVKGGAFKVVKKERIPLAKGMKLEKRDVLSLVRPCEVKLFDEAAREMVTLKDQCAGSIASLVDEQKDSRESMNVKFFNYVVSRLARQGASDHIMDGRITAIHRGDDEALFADGDAVSVQESYELSDSVCLDLPSTPFQGCSISCSVPAEKMRRAPVKLHIAFVPNETTHRKKK